jgi:hypothetical protein
MAMSCQGGFIDVSSEQAICIPEFGVYIKYYEESITSTSNLRASEAISITIFHCNNWYAVFIQLIFYGDPPCSSAFQARH